MNDQIIDPMMAPRVHADACRDHGLVGWIVTEYPAEYPNQFVARLLTSKPTPYVLLADNLAELRAMLPSQLTHLKRSPADPPEVVELWLAD